MNLSCRTVTGELESDILAKAYVPEHVVPLMTGISGAQPLLIEDYFALFGNDVLVLIGYPLQGSFEAAHLRETLIGAMRHLTPRRTFCTAPQLPDVTGLGFCEERESDYYYRLDDLEHVPAKLRRRLLSASKRLTVTKGCDLSEAHHTLLGDYASRDSMHPRVKALYRRMPEYVKKAPDAVLLNVWDEQGNLAAFFALDLSARRFATYILSCFSRRHYAPHASDLLFLEMMRHARDRGKHYLHLGLGVNPGISRFKEKWGGFRHLPYESFSLTARRTAFSRLLSGLVGS